MECIKFHDWLSWLYINVFILFHCWVEHNINWYAVHIKYEWIIICIQITTNKKKLFVCIQIIACIHDRLSWYLRIQVLSLAEMDIQFKTVLCKCWSLLQLHAEVLNSLWTFSLDRTVVHPIIVLITTNILVCCACKVVIICNGTKCISTCISNCGIR